jgi:hypothetical protein
VTLRYISAKAGQMIDRCYQLLYLISLCLSFVLCKFTRGSIGQGILYIKWLPRLLGSPK